MHTCAQGQTRRTKVSKSISQEVDVVSKGCTNVARLWRPGSKRAHTAGYQSAKALFGCAVLTGDPIVRLNFREAFRRTWRLPARVAKRDSAYGDVVHGRAFSAMHIEQGLDGRRFNVCESHIFVSPRCVEDLPRLGIGVKLAGTTEQLIGIFDVDRLLTNAGRSHKVGAALAAGRHDATSGVGPARFGHSECCAVDRRYGTTRFSPRTKADTR